MLSRALEDRNFDDLADPKLKNDYDPNEMARMVACAAASVRHSGRRRPRMSQVGFFFFFFFKFFFQLPSYLNSGPSLLIELTKNAAVKSVEARRWPL